MALTASAPRSAAGRLPLLPPGAGVRVAGRPGGVCGGGCLCSRPAPTAPARRPAPGAGSVLPPPSPLSQGFQTPEPGRPSQAAVDGGMGPAVATRGRRLGFRVRGSLRFASRRHCWDQGGGGRPRRKHGPARRALRGAGRWARRGKPPGTSSSPAAGRRGTGSPGLAARLRSSKAD